MMGKPPMKNLKYENNLLTGINKEGALNLLNLQFYLLPYTRFHPNSSNLYTPK